MTNGELMENLFIEFVDLYTNKKTRAFAYNDFIRSIYAEEYQQLSQNELQYLVMAIRDFTTDFKKTFFWKRATMVNAHLRLFRQHVKALSTDEKNS